MVGTLVPWLHGVVYSSGDALNTYGHIWRLAHAWRGRRGLQQTPLKSCGGRRLSLSALFVCKIQGLHSKNLGLSCRGNTTTPSSLAIIHKQVKRSDSFIGQ